MYILERLSVKNLWGSRHIAVNFNPDITFLTGPNGSGKTALVNLLVAALTADDQQLKATPFESIEICLRQSDSKLQTTIEVTSRTFNDQGDGFAYLFTFSDGEKRPFVLSDSPPLARYPGLGKSRRQKKLIDTLYDIVNIRCLPVQRIRDRPKEQTSSNLFFPPPERDTWHVDKELKEQASELQSLFSELRNKSFTVFASFQDSVFLSLIEDLPFDSVSPDMQEISEDREYTELSGLMQSLYLTELEYGPVLRQHLDKLRTARERFHDTAQLSSDDIGVLFAAARLRRVHNKFSETKSKQAEILRSQDDFIKAVNAFFTGKTVAVSRQNTLIVQLPNNETLDLNLLSSGEKQLLILLSDCFLQQYKSTLYVADEPEISLHVEWQEKLVSTMMTLNPNAQLVFATHSPDIVATYADRTLTLGAKG